MAKAIDSLETSTDVIITTKPRVPASVKIVAAFLAEKSSLDSKTLAKLSAEQKKAFERLIAASAAPGKANELITELGNVIVVGLGPTDKITAETLRAAGGALAKFASKQKISNLAVVVPDFDDAAGSIANGIYLGSFRFKLYKGTASPKRESKTLECTIVTDAKGEVERAVILGEAQNFARTVASRPGNDINPPTLAKVAVDLARAAGLKSRVLDEREMKRLGMGGILAVGCGSYTTPPRMIVLEHRGRGAKGAPLLVVGKAVTFDTGGISIKPADKMGKMIFDKCGGMAVLGLMYAAAKLKLPGRIVGILGAAENHISHAAYRPGDILRMYNGVTVEVTNTDAEGRLVLGDALAWGIETYKPSAVLNLATLTGGVIVALGRSIAGIMSNNDALAEEIIRIGAGVGEKLWRLPLGDEQRDQLKSDCADIVNSAGRDGHPLQGGAFLSHFVPSDGKTPWAHLDIAGVADTDRELACYAKGATGWGVRTLVQWAQSRG